MKKLFNAETTNAKPITGSLRDIANSLKNTDNKVQLIYAFNGTGKTRLSQTFKDLVKSESKNNEPSRSKILYYNAYTEDLFSWDNDLENNIERKLTIKSNSFTSWIFKDQGKENEIVDNFQKYTNKKLSPIFNHDFSEVSFSIFSGNDKSLHNIKISKGEESIFIWSIFYTLIKQILTDLSEEKDNKTTNSIKYIFIDDPVSSLDENHLIQSAIDLALLTKIEQNQTKFIITTHSTLFYNVLYNQLNIRDNAYMLIKKEDDNFELPTTRGDSNRAFSYHLFLKETIQEAIQNENIEKIHFMLLRNLYEKTASFLGYPKWSCLLPKEEDKKSYEKYMNLYSHSSLSNEEPREQMPQQKNIVKYLFEHLMREYKFFKEDKANESN